MNNLAIRCIFNKDVVSYTKDEDGNKIVDNLDYEYWKYLMFNSISMSLFKVRNATTLILAVDDKASWRYYVWPRYKEDRKKKKAKDKTQFPWNEFFVEYHKFLTDVREHLPIKVIDISKCEGDDIIGVITNNTTADVEIISTDKDFLQLSSKRVKIYNPMKQQHVTHPNTKMFLLEQCLCGQSKDSIFNIKTPLDHPEGKRKPGFGGKAFEKVMEYGAKQWLLDNDLVDRYKFNKVLMDFNMIPAGIQRTIMAEFNDYVYPDPEHIWEFIKMYDWPEVIDNFTNVENKLLELY